MQVRILPMSLIKYSNKNMKNQVTTEEQSKRLLELRIPAEKAKHEIKNH